MITETEAKENVKSGWMKIWMAFEVLAIKEQVAKESLEGLIDKLDNGGKVKIYKKDFGDIKKVERPLKNVETGYSITSEIEMVCKNFQDLIQIVIEFGPSAIEILEPLEFNLKAGEAQTILNAISNMIHRFAAAGAGGMLIIKDKV